MVFYQDTPGILLLNHVLKCKYISIISSWGEEVNEMSPNG